MNNQDAMLGRIVRQFTETENIFRQIGAMIDVCIPTEDEIEFESLVAEMYIKICSLQKSVETYANDLKLYLHPEERETNDEGDQT